MRLNLIDPKTQKLNEQDLVGGRKIESERPCLNPGKRGHGAQFQG